jgi:DNA end-binding protein Ku
MPVRATWKGVIKLSLITIPIRVFPATNPASDVSFRQLHRKCKTPIQMKKWCPHCDEEVSSDEIVKGHETAKGRFVLVEEEEIAKLRPESTRTVEISHIVEASTIDPIYIERAYFLAPDSKAAGSSFAVLRESLADRAGVGRLALHGREYLVAVLPRDNALIMYTLRTAGEVRDAKGIDALDLARVKVKPDELKLARQVLQHFDSGRDLASFTDHYQQSLRAMLKEKERDDEVVEVDEGKPSGKPSKVVNLMDALRQSLNRVETRKPARAGARARKSVRAHAKPRRRAS